MVQVVQEVSLDDMHSESIWFCGLNHQIIKKSWDVTPVTDGRRDGGGKWKIEQCSVGPETAIQPCCRRKSPNSEREVVQGGRWREQTNRLRRQNQQPGRACPDLVTNISAPLSMSGYFSYQPSMSQIALKMCFTENCTCLTGQHAGPPLIPGTR